MITLANISKHFGPLAALTDVSLSIPPARVLGLLGENGAGKSTLMNILFGLLRPSSGQIRINDAPVHFSSPRDAQRAGIGMVHQHFKLVPPLTSVENISVFLPGSRAVLRNHAADWLTRLRWSLNLDTPVERLTVGEQQRVEIIKALMTIDHHRHAADTASASTLILDEPTAVLTPQETAELFTAVKTLKAAGTAVIFISHKLAEIREVCDDLAILRRGKLVHTGPARDLPADALAEKMVGSKIELPRLSRTRSVSAGQSPPLPEGSPLAQATTPPSPAEGPSSIQNQKSKIKNPLLQLTNLSTPKLHSLSFRIAPGEILGIAGVDGNGQSELVQTLLGAIPPTGGTITLNNEDATHKSMRWRTDRIASIAEDRHKEALVLPLSIRDNLLLKDYRRPEYATSPAPFRWLRFSQWQRHALDLIKRFDIRCNSPADTAAQLSGGNQQKTVLARELHASGPDAKPIVIAVNPTRGLDVGATAFVMQTLLTAREHGAAILLVHSDLDELLAISDRVLVIYNGTLTPTDWPNTTKDAIGRFMLGLPAPTAAGDAA